MSKMNGFITVLFFWYAQLPDSVFSITRASIKNYLSVQDDECDP